MYNYLNCRSPHHNTYHINHHNHRNTYHHNVNYHRVHNCTISYSAQRADNNQGCRGEQMRQRPVSEWWHVYAGRSHVHMLLYAGIQWTELRKYVK